LNKDNARFVAEAGAATKGLREHQAGGEQLETVLTRALADYACSEAERDALQTMTRRRRRPNWSVCAKLVNRWHRPDKARTQFDAQRQLLADYRIRLGFAGSAGGKRRFY
jgi:hypothetical protein